MRSTIHAPKYAAVPQFVLALPSRKRRRSTWEVTPIRWFVVCVALVFLPGCGAWHRGASPTYTTVVATPNRDRDEAIAENKKAGRLFTHGKLEHAEQALQRALIADVNYGPAHNNLGKVYFKMGKYYLAAWEFEYASRLMPERAEPRNNLGQVYEATNRLDQAIDAYNEAYAIAPQDPEVLGNLVRALVQRDAEDPAIRPLLLELVMYESRPVWVTWAKDRLALMTDSPVNAAPVDEPSVTRKSTSQTPIESDRFPAPVLELDELPAPSNMPQAPNFMLQGL